MGKCADGSGNPCNRQTTGLLQRRHVKIDLIKCIGKESNSLESVDEGMVHSEQNVYTDYADPRRTEWIVKIQPVLKNARLDVLVKACGKKLSRRELIELRAARSQPHRGTGQLLAEILKSLKPGTKAATGFCQSFLGAGFGRYQAGDAVVDGKLAVAFAGMFDDGVGQVFEADLFLVGVGGVVFGEGIDHQGGHAFIVFGFDGLGAVGEGFFHVGDDGGFVFELLARRIFFGGRFLAVGQIGEEVTGGGGVNQALGESSGGGRGFAVVLVFGIVFGHGDEFAADFIPLFEQSGGLAGGCVGRRRFFCGVLSVCGSMRGKNQKCGDKKYGQQTSGFHGPSFRCANGADDSAFWKKSARN